MLVAMRPGETPVPIPNTMVKTWAADGTALETMWESRWLPDFKNKTDEAQTSWGCQLSWESTCLASREVKWFESLTISTLAVKTDSLPESVP